MAKPISELVTSKLELVTSIKSNYKLLVNKLSNLEIRVRVLEIGGNLLSTEQPHDLTGWYCKCYKELGEQKFMMVASIARQGKYPNRLFSWLLKQELDKIQH